MKKTTAKTKYANEERIEELRKLRAEGKARQAERLLNDLIVSNDGLVYKVARRELKAKAQNEDNLEEAAQEGRIGLLRAIEDYDASKGGFTTYACFWIRHHVQTCAQKQGDFERHRAGRMPAEVAKKCNKIRLLEGREPTHEDVGVTREEWDAWHERSFVVSLQDAASHGDDSDGERLEDVTADTRVNPEDVATDAKLRQRIDDAMAVMSPRNRDLTRALFVDGMSLAEAAEEFGISAERVRQLRPILDGRLRKSIKAQDAKRRAS